MKVAMLLADAVQAIGEKLYILGVAGQLYYQSLL
jgi:hypothetical protein